MDQFLADDLVVAKFIEEPQKCLQFYGQQAFNRSAV